ncbi:FMN-dependent NADH-azoreductase [Avrilella dinanensis]|uniref:FMN dependent NADH:quinone oxidoreductase n=1 Tax=Avrilella dinanensis TaxID=2008672 RepID=A0A2M9R5C9_9FLAO|nr:NAD(P)H-dependent oxidoreductase [Avrilella dinanensis]PJR04054.1 FMN-dependent NADH-azoreductase [Avrilella dinanensis]
MNILRLVTSFKGNESQSYQLGNKIVEKLKNQLPITNIVTRNLAKNEMPHLNEMHFTSFMTPTDKLSDELKDAVSYSDQALEELISSDIIVIDVPMYNFTIPSSLKAWIDHVVRTGITFRYTENGVEGLVKNKTVYLAISSGGVYSDGPMKDFDFTEKYLKNILGFIGLTDIHTFRVEGVAIPGIKETAMSRAVQSIESQLIIK